jgi:hypothetical protein
VINKSNSNNGDQVGDIASMGPCTVKSGVKRMGYDEFGALTVQMAEIVIHAEYNSWNLNNDVAVLRGSLRYTGQPCFIEFNHFKCQLLVLLAFLTSKLFTYIRPSHSSSG